MGFGFNSFKKAVTPSARVITNETDAWYSSGGSGGSLAKKIIDSGLSFDQMLDLYKNNEWLRACIDRIVERSSNIEFAATPNNVDLEGGIKISDKEKAQIDIINELLQMPNDQYESLSDIRKKYDRDLLLYDAGAIELVNNLSNKQASKVSLYAVGGNSLKKNINKANGLLVPKKSFVQLERGTQKELASWSIDEMIYSSMNPMSNRVYGLSPIETLVRTVMSDLYAAKYNMDFFKNNATPRIAVMMEGVGKGQGSAAVTRFREFWDKELKGKPHRPIILTSEGGNVKVEKLTMSNDEMQFQAYSIWLLVKIMVVYKMQAAVLGVQLGDKLSRAETAEQERLFKKDAIRPLAKEFADKLNRKVVWGKYGFNQIHIGYMLDVVDRKEESEWMERYLRTGVLTINEIRVNYLSLRPVGWGNVPYLQNNVTAFGQGKNGPAVPVDESLLNLNEASSKEVEAYIMDDERVPVGWENFDMNKRMEIIRKIRSDRYSTKKVFMLNGSN